MTNMTEWCQQLAFNASQLVISLWLYISEVFMFCFIMPFHVTTFD